MAERPEAVGDVTGLAHCDLEKGQAIHDALRQTLHFCCRQQQQEDLVSRMDSITDLVSVHHFTSHARADESVSKTWDS